MILTDMNFKSRKICLLFEYLLIYFFRFILKEKGGPSGRLFLYYFVYLGVFRFVFRRATIISFEYFFGVRVLTPYACLP